jgi:fibronectin type 3 domain-containing protein
MDFATAVTKASMALAAELAQPVATLPAPAGLEARRQTLGSLFSSVKTVFLTWRSTSGQAVGYNVYRSTNRTSFEKANSSVLTTTTFTDRRLKAGVDYYYVVTAVDAQGRESNFSAEVRDDGKLP